MGPLGPSTLRRVLDPPVNLAARGLLAAITLGDPVRTVTRARQIGRAFAGSRFNRRHLLRASGHIAFAFPEWDDPAVHEHALRSYEHLFETGVEFAYAPRLMADDRWTQHIELAGLGGSVRALLSGGPAILISGHVGNWEFLAFLVTLLGFPMHALYRPLDNRSLDGWLQRTRARRGLTLVDKFGAARQLPRILAGGSTVGFVADQNGGDRGVFVPFFNRLTSTYKSIGLLAMGLNATIGCAMARRLPEPERKPGGLGFVFEGVDTFGPEDWNTHPDPLFYLTARYRRAIETMIRRAPEQYLWMHRIWRSRAPHERQHKPFPKALREKIALLPWVTGEDLERIVENSRRDAETLAKAGTHRLP